MPDSPNRVDLSLDARLMKRLVRYARQRGTTPEAILIQSVTVYLDGAVAPDPHEASQPQGPKRGPRKGG
ncbi:hypothetical protein [Paraburkholderia humisilvae]|uniref:Ribbon-helix-helix protein CopG domain-containing protein n=1 Tax=Paraburkholderia humisilvae TaxID=627669 RepID=A0A6J5DZ33_9BURK|nr:hypothetical protein [Paraburkholderia humisilvae]CAB3758724.1 hypothetical protein LMG29542_03414 [Paraburkholderia humisilvae]